MNYQWSTTQTGYSICILRGALKQRELSIKLSMYLSAGREARLITTSTRYFWTCLQVTHTTTLRSLVCVQTSRNSPMCHLQTTNCSCPCQSRGVIQTNPTADFILFLGQHQKFQPSFSKYLCWHLSCALCLYLSPSTSCFLKTSVLKACLTNCTVLLGILCHIPISTIQTLQHCPSLFPLLSWGILSLSLLIPSPSVLPATYDLISPAVKHSSEEQDCTGTFGMIS